MLSPTVLLFLSQIMSVMHHETGVLFRFKLYCADQTMTFPPHVKATEEILHSD